jgi:hypothetical protein
MIWATRESVSIFPVSAYGTQSNPDVLSGSPHSIRIFAPVNTIGDSVQFSPIDHWWSCISLSRDGSANYNTAISSGSTVNRALAGDHDVDSGVDPIGRLAPRRIKVTRTK